MAIIGDGGAILTHGWFPDDGLVPNEVEVFTHGWWGVAATTGSKPNIITFLAKSAETYTFDGKSAETYTFTVGEG